MAPFWKCAVGALLSATWWAGPVMADLGVFSNLDDFTKLADAQEGKPSQTFRSSDIVAPLFHAESLGSKGADDAGYIFMGTVYGEEKAGPMIFDAKDMSLVYADQKYTNAYYSNAQVVNGTRYLIFWEGAHSRGHANGFCLVFDESYNQIYNVTAQGLHDALADMHEASFTNDGTIVFSTYWNIRYNCSSVGGPEDTLLMDSGFQEVDPATNEVLFHWAASEHFDITESFAQYDEAYGVSETSGFDFAHINSIQKTDDGNYLISCRHLSLLALIDGTDGHPIWVLGGKNNQFKDLSDGQATNFGWQHDAKFLHNQNHITMFDNHGETTGHCELDECKTRGLHLEIDATEKTVRVVQEYYHPRFINSGAMGGFSTLENGNSIVGWGYSPGFVEFKPDGTPVMDVQRGKIGVDFQSDMFAYRVHKSNWTGRPSWPPSAAVDSPFGTTENATVYLSWNGATDIASWAVMASDDPLHMEGPDNLVAEANRTGFETAVYLGPGTGHARQYIGAAALNANGQVLGSTVVLDMSRGGVVVLMPSLINNVHGQVHSSTVSGNGASMFGGALVSLGGLTFALHYCYRRRRARGGADGEKHTYKRVDGDESRLA